MGNDEKDEKKELSYFISERPPFSVIIFVGAMTKATLSIMEECHKDLDSRSATLSVIVFRDVTNVDLTVLPILTRLQKSARDKGALRICSVRPELKALLVEKGVLRLPEIFNNLTDALESLKSAAPVKK